MNSFGIMVGLDRKNAFEGWFCKIDDKKNDWMISVIWGYSTHETFKHAFIQFQDSVKHQTTYVRYPMQMLSWTKEPFVLRIGKNELSMEGMRLDFEAEGVSVRGDFSFSPFQPIKMSLLKPNIMGWLTYFPNECNHAITSMMHHASGTFQMGEKVWDVVDAAVYMEKDWGSGFPKEYVWAQANDWETSSVVFSYASVPMLGKHQKGFFLVLHHEGVEYRFSSIEGSKMVDFQVEEGAFSVSIKKGSTLLRLKAKQAHPVPLAAPVQGEMKAHIKESLDGTLELTLRTKGGKEITLASHRASIDVHF
jgi:hypothetical protein